MKRGYRYYRNHIIRPFLEEKGYVLPSIERFFLREIIKLIRLGGADAPIIRNTPRSNGRKRGYNQKSIRPKPLTCDFLSERKGWLITRYYNFYDYYLINYNLKKEG